MAKKKPQKMVKKTTTFDRKEELGKWIVSTLENPMLNSGFQIDMPNGTYEVRKIKTSSGAKAPTKGCIVRIDNSEEDGPKKKMKECFDRTFEDMAFESGFENIDAKAFWRHSAERFTGRLISDEELALIEDYNRVARSANECGYPYESGKIKLDPEKVRYE